MFSFNFNPKMICWGRGPMGPKDGIHFFHFGPFYLCYSPYDFLSLVQDAMKFAASEERTDIMMGVSNETQQVGG